MNWTVRGGDVAAVWLLDGRRTDVGRTGSSHPVLKSCRNSHSAGSAGSLRSQGCVVLCEISVACQECKRCPGKLPLYSTACEASALSGDCGSQCGGGMLWVGGTRERIAANYAADFLIFKIQTSTVFGGRRGPRVEARKTAFPEPGPAHSSRWQIWRSVKQVA